MDILWTTFICFTLDMAIIFVSVKLLRREGGAVEKRGSGSGSGSGPKPPKKDDGSSGSGSGSGEGPGDDGHELVCDKSEERVGMYLWHMMETIGEDQPAEAYYNGKKPSPCIVSGHYQTASETPLKWRFAGGLIVAHFCIFTWNFIRKTPESSQQINFTHSEWLYRNLAVRKCPCIGYKQCITPHLVYCYK